MQVPFASRAALRIALLYIIAAGAWIFFSDMAIAAALPDHIARMQTIKGSFFVIVTGVILYGLIRRSFAREMSMHNSRRESQHRWRELVEHTSDAVIILDGRRIVYANTVAAKLIGAAESDELIGRDVDAFLITGHLERIERRIGHVACGREMPSRPFRIRRLDGAERTIEAHSTSIKFYDHPVVLSILVDITEQLEQKAALMRAKEEAERLAHMKTTILNNMSHEIRTPLTGILGISEALAAEVSGDARELTGLLQESGWRLMRTFDSILTLAQLEGDDAPLPRDPVDLVGVSSRIVRSFQLKAEEKGIQLEIDALEEDVLVLCNHAALDQVIMNLVSNAIKFTHRGGVTVTIDVDDGAACVQVQDTGVGISESFMPYVFDEYRQESEGISRDFEGSGLGMTIVRRLLEKMDGEINITSEKGTGTTVRATLPLASCLTTSKTRPALGQQ